MPQQSFAPRGAFRVGSSKIPRSLVIGYDLRPAANGQFARPSQTAGRLNAIPILAMSQDADAGLKGHYLLPGTGLLLGTVTGDAPCRAGEALFA
jgi:hypothetical protein